MAYRYLDWDSAFFGKKIFQIKTSQQISAEEWEDVLKEKPDLIYCIIENPTTDTALSIEKRGGILYDIKLTYFKDTFTLTSPERDGFYCESASVLSDKLETMAYQSGIFSRFRIDPALSFRFKDLYKEWLVNSLNRKLADEVFVIKDVNGCEIAFVTLGVRDLTGSIGLLAVDENYRGRGIGSLLLQNADNYFLRKQVTSAEVVTQSNNIPACRLYEKMGYAISKKEFVYHYYL